MRLAGEYVFEAGVEEVWDALFDPAVLAAVMPGCEKLELVDGSYLGEIKVKVGPIQGKFSGKVDLSDQLPPKSYKMVVDGRGAQGFVKATASIELVPEGAQTRVRYDSDAQVGGKIASVGQRLVETSAKAIVKQSLEGLAENIKIRAEAYRAHAAHTGLERVASSESASPPAPISAPAAAVAPAPVVAPAKPVVQYKQANAGKLAGAVAKEVTKTLAPIIGAVVLVLAVVIYLLAH